MTTFDEVLTQYQPMIRSILRKTRIYRDHDVFRQAAAIALWKVWENYDESKGSFTGYAYRSMYGAVLDELKRTTKDIPVETSYFDMEYVANTESHIDDLLAILPSTQRDVLILCYIHGFTALEIAQILNISEPGIKKRKKVALAKLRVHLLKEL